ncbi:MAG: hypothetical protein IJS22_02130 [Lachnospiraceae bacterium]|nr:hypothetical protein [Lachnospiraceae bacterium]
MKEKILKNWPFMLLSLVLSFIVWFVVIQTTDPQTSKGFSIPIEFTNESIIADRGMVVTSVGEESVQIKVTSARSIVNSLSADDFSAVADYSKMYRDTQVPVTVTSLNTKIKNTDIELRSASVEVALESLQNVTRVIEYTINGEPATGYVVNGVSLSPDSVTITCPESFVQYVRSARVALDVTDMNETATVSAQLGLYDGNDDVIDVDAEKNISWNTNGVIEARIEISQVQAVPVVVNISDTDKVAEGYAYTGYSVNISTVKLYGSREKISAISEIPLPAISVAGLNSDLTREIDIRSLLPEGVDVYKDNTSVSVTAKIEKLEERTIEVDPGDVILKVADEKLSVRLMSGQVPVTVKGLAADINQIGTADISIVVDLNGLSVGEHEVEPQVTVNRQGCEVVSVSKVTVTIEEDAEQTAVDDTPSSGADGNDG